MIDTRLTVMRSKTATTREEILHHLKSEFGIDAAFCRLEWCRKLFVPKKAGHGYCCNQHKDEDWNKNRR